MKQFESIVAFYKLSILLQILITIPLHIKQLYQLKEMSYYGHLTQSTIIPKKSKEIQIGNSGLGELQAILSQAKKTVGPQQMPKYITKTKTQKQSSSIIPLQQPLKNNTISQTKLVQHKLKIKTKIYEQLQKAGGDTKDGLIDFVQKSIQNNPEYEKMRKQFYEQKMKQIREKRQNVNKYFQLSNNQDRERLAWEKRKLEELTDMQKEMTEDKVMQSYDKVLTKDQRQALEQVIKQQQEQKKRISQGKRRRQIDYEQRIRKLRKLGVLEE